MSFVAYGPLALIIIGQGPSMLAEGACGVMSFFFFFFFSFSISLFLSHSLKETARYGLKYCLKGPLKPY